MPAYKTDGGRERVLKVFTVRYNTGHNKEVSNGLAQHQAIPRVQSYNGNVAYNMVITEAHNKVTKPSSNCIDVPQTQVTISSLRSVHRAAQTLPTYNSACLEEQVTY